MWCPLPWTHISVKNNGTLRVCSHSQSAGKNTLLFNGKKQLSINDLSVDTLNCSTLKQVRKDIIEGKWPEQCKRCEIEFTSGAESRNVWESKNQTISTKELLDNTLEDGTLINPQITSYDLRIGNFCNLRCVMCFPGESSKWYDIYEEIYEKSSFNIDDITYKISEGFDQLNWIRHRTNVDNIYNSAPLLNKISFSGGEPMVIKNHMDILRGVIDKGLSSQIELEYQTNLTIIPDTLLNLWKKFKKVIVCASIDGVGKANEAFRYPSNWSTIESNLRLLDSTEDNIEVFTSSTIHLLSLEHNQALNDWLCEQNYKKINKQSEDKNFSSHIVYNPKYLSIGLLDEEDFDLVAINNSRYPYYKNLYNQIKIKEDQIKPQRKLFVTNFHKFELNQKQDWSSIFPEIYIIMKKWENE